MNEELRRLLADARAALERPNVTLEQVNAILQEDNGVTFAQLEQMENQERLSAVTQPEVRRPRTAQELKLSPAQRLRQQLRPQSDIARMVARGATLGGSEEITALPGLLGGESFGARRQRGEAETRAARERVGPKLSFAAEMGGGFAIPGGALARTAAKAPTLLGKIGVGALGGTGIGAVSGALEAPELADVPANMALGAGLGAALGTVIPGAAAGASLVGRTIRGVFFPRAARHALAAQAIRGTNVSPDKAQRVFLGLEEARPGQAILADIDPRFGNLLREIVNEGGPRADDILGLLEARTLRSGQRLAAEARGLAGIEGTGLRAAARGVKKRLRKEADEMFDELEDVLVPIDSPEMQNLLRDPEVAKIWNRVRPRTGKPALGRKKPRTLVVDAQGQPLAVDPGGITGGPIPFRHIQQLRRGIAGEAKKAWQSGNGALGDDLTQAKILLDDILEGVPDIGPRFRAVNRGYAQKMVTLNAFDDGAKATSKRISAEEVQDQLTALQRAGPEADEALQAYRHGFVDQTIRNRLTGEAAASTAGRKVRNLEFTDFGEKMRAVLGDEDAFRAMIRGGLAEQKFSGTAAAVVGNSTTTQQLLTLLRGARQALVQGPGAAVIEATQAASMEAILSARAIAIADILLGRAPRDLARLLKILGHRPLPPLGVGAAAGATSPAVRALLESLGRAPEQGFPAEATAVQPQGLLQRER